MKCCGWMKEKEKNDRFLFPRIIVMGSLHRTDFYEKVVSKYVI